MANINPIFDLVLPTFQKTDEIQALSLKYLDAIKDVGDQAIASGVSDEVVVKAATSLGFSLLGAAVPDGLVRPAILAQSDVEDAVDEWMNEGGL